VAQSFKDVGVINAKLQRKLPDMVMKGLYRLYRFQLDDGGWSWCEYGKADLWMTSYVCYGLIRARDAGFPVNPDVLKRGGDRIARSLAETKSVNNTTAYQCYVLSLAGYDTERYFEQALRRHTFNTSGLAYAAMSLARSGHMDLAKTALARMFAGAIQQPGFVHWTNHSYWVYDDVQTTAVALQAALAVDPEDARIPQIVRWLMLQRTDNYWYSTRQTAEVIYAMAEYLKHTKELSPDYRATVKVNGTLVGTFRFDRASIFDVEKVVAVPARLVRKGRNSVQIEKTGEGNLYYNLELTQFIAKKTIPAALTAL